MPQPSEHEIEVFNTALELSGAERISYLNQACAVDSALRQRVEEFLQAEDKLGVFLESRPARPPYPAGTVRLAQIQPEKAGDRIGRYKLLQQIGEGGCGVVYMAEQEEPVKRQVALKVIKLGMDTKNVIARFEAERQVLALMDHPNIAKVLDAGATDIGRPYFVMELVRGIKITDYCDQNNLSTEVRLDLFMQTCRAVQHAHQKGIIHRDIKPSNILITMNDGVPMPKVIDFGIAKATQGKLTDHTVFSAFEQFIGTSANMSPEQAEMSAMDIDTRSDLYSLGVLLYELLTGKTPFDAADLWQAGIDGMRRCIREQEPARPSTRLSTMLAADLTTVAAHRQAAAPKLVNLLRGDLDWIVMKCLEKDRTRRYETASGLASDIKRHIDNEPVVARPPSNFYRFQKMARRNKLAFGAAVAVTVSLILGLGFSSFLFMREKEALSNENVAELKMQSALKAAQASEERARTAEAAEGLLRNEAEDRARRLGASAVREAIDTALHEQKEGRTYAGGFRMAVKLGGDLHDALSQEYFNQIDALPLALQPKDLPLISPTAVNADNRLHRQVELSSGFIDLVNHLCHAKAIDKVQAGFFNHYVAELSASVAANPAGPLPPIVGSGYWTSEILNDELNYFNQMMGATIAINMSHHYLGHYAKYSGKLTGPGDKTVPINGLLTPAEWNASVKAGVLDALNCALATDGVRALFDALDKMPVRPPWADYIAPPNADLKLLNKNLARYEDDFFHGRKMN